MRTFTLLPRLVSSRIDTCESRGFYGSGIEDYSLVSRDGVLGEPSPLIGLELLTQWCSVTSQNPQLTFPFKTEQCNVWELLDISGKTCRNIRERLTNLKQMVRIKML